ncbi:MAG: hypothetical protein ABJG41_08880 [Cyclobacteriaceae bacterium]
MEKDKKYKRAGWLTSVLVQIGMLLLFYFLIAWKEPFPPIPTYGIELNFGFDQSGGGSEPVTSQNQPVEESEENIEETLEENIEATIPEETLEESEEETAPLEATEEVIDPTEDITTEEVFEDAQSPDVVSDEVIDEVEPEEIVAEPEQPEIQEEPEDEEPEEPAVEEETVNENALMPTSENADSQNASQGESTPEGDEGKEEGTLDGRALYGSQGSSDGASLQMAGWTWDFKPEPNDNSIETGKIVYKITIDRDGYLSGIEVVSSTVSPAVERLYRQSVERLSFSKTNDYQSAPTSTGYVTFIITSK